MNNPDLIVWAVTHQVYGTARTLVDIDDRRDGRPDCDASRDRGAVSLEQVLWFVAAGVSVAVIAAILWSQIRTTAETTPAVPAAP